VNDDICVAIDKEPFKKDIIAMREHHRVFEADMMKSSLQQLSLCGFTKVQRYAKISDSLDK
ncbi:PREDICTED: heat shock transcription factor, Y-linked-like, partial [Eurypyga helias]|uniref:heat shock transcription factor, Y-linked-like n=1 Tax=Eurypyga helias TaxID=54383 RepID=UPI0005280A3A